MSDSLAASQELERLSQLAYLTNFGTRLHFYCAHELDGIICLLHRHCEHVAPLSQLDLICLCCTVFVLVCHEVSERPVLLS